MSKYWWLSFVDRIGDEVAVQLGVCIVPGADLHTAIRAAWRAGCNPGGEVAGHPLPHEVADLRRCIRFDQLCRLLVDPGDIAEVQFALQRKYDEDVTR